MNVTMKKGFVPMKKWSKCFPLVSISLIHNTVLPWLALHTNAPALPFPAILLPPHPFIMPPHRTTAWLHSSSIIKHGRVIKVPHPLPLPFLFPSPFAVFSMVSVRAGFISSTTTVIFLITEGTVFRSIREFLWLIYLKIFLNKYF